MKKRNCPILYLIVPCYNEEEIIEFSIKSFKNVIADLVKKKDISKKSKIILVNDGSTDNTWEIIKKSIKKEKLFNAINLSTNCGHQNALIAGLDYARNKCDITISIDADLQQDINKIGDFIAKYKEGNEIVYGIRKNRKNDSIFMRICFKMFNIIMKVMKSKYLYNHADYRLLSNKVLCCFEKYNEKNLFLRGLIPTMGFKHDYVYFDVFKREKGKSSYTFSKRLNLAIDGIVSLSYRPFNLVKNFSVFLFLLSLVLIIYSIINYINTVLIIGIIIMCTSFIILFISLIGIYLEKIMIETKNRPRYLIDEII